MRLIPKIFLCLLAGNVQALETDRLQEIVIHADKARLNTKTQEVVYTGQVILTQGTIKITADELILIKQGKKLSLATAIGTKKPATYQQQLEKNQGLTKAKATRIVYRLQKNHVELLGKGKLMQMGNVLTGERIVYNLKTQMAQAGSKKASPKSDQRVKVIIQPIKEASE